jgi:hypothetical protein
MHEYISLLITPTTRLLLLYRVRIVEGLAHAHEHDVGQRRQTSFTRGPAPVPHLI